MDFIDHFKTVFRGREDVVAEHWEFFDRRESKKRCGYRPICNNRKVKGICPKFDNPKFGCAKCIATNFVPITDELLRKHFDGRKILGVYPLLRDNTCWFIAADFDNHDGEHDPYRDILSFYEVCEAQEVPIYICRSKSGKGYHAYMFFDKPIPAWKARVVMFALIQEAQIIDEDEKISDFDKNDKIKSSDFDMLFPAQDELKGEGSIGNLMAMEFQGKAVSNGNTVFLDPFPNLLILTLISWMSLRTFSGFLNRIWILLLTNGSLNKIIKFPRRSRTMRRYQQRSSKTF